MYSAEMDGHGGTTPLDWALKEEQNKSRRATVTGSESPLVLLPSRLGKLRWVVDLTSYRR
jgi:hypothetical protein